MRTEFFGDWLHPQGLITGSSVVLFDDRDRRMLLSILDPDRDGNGVDPARFRVLDILIPHFRRAAAIHRHVAEAALARSATQATLDSMTVGVALAGPDGRLHCHNAAFEATLRSDDGFHLRQGRLTATERADFRALETALRWAASPAPDPARHPGIVAVARPSGRRPYTVLVSPFRPRGSVPAEPLALLLVNDPDADQAEGLDWLARLWRLTPAEARVLQALVAGERLADIAERTGVSQNTVKTHLKAVLQKSDCHGQSDLIRVALRSTGGFRAVA